MCLQARCNVQSFCLFSKAHARAPSGQSSQSLALVIASRVPYPLARSMNNSAHSLYLHFFSFIPLSPTRRLMLRAQNSNFAPRHTVGANYLFCATDRRALSTGTPNMPLVSPAYNHTVSSVARVLSAARTYHGL